MEMTLAFSTQFPKEKPGLEGKPTHFIEKIWAGLIHGDEFNFNTSHYEEYLDAHQSLFGTDFGYDEIMIDPKIHTMRSDSNDRWQKGKKIHSVINNRTPNRFQFAPTIPCTGFERVKIKWYGGNERLDKAVRVYIEGKEIGCGIWNKNFETQPIFTGKQMFELRKNDGFESLQDFFAWFNEDWSGKIIHWTSFRYRPEAIEVFDEQLIDEP